MKINITTAYEKSLKYRVYDVDGKKRKLIKKGKFTKTASVEVTPVGKEIIVRITPGRGVKVLTVPFVGLINFFRNNRSFVNEFTLLRFFDEIRIKDVTRSAVAEIRYNISPFRDKTYEQYEVNRKYVDHLICDTHPYEEEMEKIGSVNRFCNMAGSLFVIAVICGVVLLLVNIFGNN